MNSGIFKITITLLGFLCLSGIAFWTFNKSLISLPVSKCLVDKTVEIDQAFRTNSTMFFVFDDAQKILIDVCTPKASESSDSGVITMELEHGLLEADLKNWDLKASSLIPEDFKIVTIESMPGKNDIKLLISKKNEMRAIFLDRKCIQEISFERDTQSTEKPLYYRITRVGEYFIVVCGSQLMRWRRNSKNFERLANIVLPGRARGFAYVTESNHGNNELLAFCDDMDCHYSINLETARITKQAIKRDSSVHQIFLTFEIDKAGRRWMILKETLKSSIFVEENNDYSNKTLHTMVRGQRNFASTGIDPLDSLLISMKSHTVYESKNWPYPPTEFNSIAIDNEGNPILLTDEEGLFKLVDGKWQRLFVTENLGLSTLKQLRVLPDNRICMLTWSGSGGLFSPPREQAQDGIVLFDPSSNSHQILRIKWKN